MGPEEYSYWSYVFLPKIRSRNKVVTVSLVLVGIFVCAKFRSIIWVIKEFGLQRNYNTFIFEDYDNDVLKGKAKIQKTLHQIFFNVSDKSALFWKKYHHYHETWKDLNPDYEYILWNKSMVTDLIVTHYPEVLPTFQRHKTRFVTQTDIARYLIIHHMGGVYVDIDIKCKRGIKALYDKMGTKTIALNITYNPIGIVNDFFIASKNHKFLEHVIDGVVAADFIYFSPYLYTMLKTGPLFLYGRYLNYPYKSEIYFTPVELIHSLTDRLHFGRSWYEWDGIIIAFIWDRIGRFVFILPIIIVFLVKVLHQLVTN